jgi:O-antigen ligase
MNTGVTTNKNSLGLIVLVISLGALWNVHSLLAHKKEPNRSRRLMAQSILLAFGVALFAMAGSATCVACFVLGGGIILATGSRAFKRRPARVHALCAAIILAGAVTFLFGGEAGVVNALGRNLSLTGRTDIWAAVIPAVPNSIIGAGFEGFWISPSAQIFQRKLQLAGWWHPENFNEAHNGFIETYLNLGWIGVCLIALVLISGYRRAATALQSHPELGSLILAYIAVAAIYSITEAAFRLLCVSWTFFLFAVVGANGITSGLICGSRARGRPYRAAAPVDLEMGAIRSFHALQDNH